MCGILYTEIVPYMHICTQSTLLKTLILLLHELHKLKYDYSKYVLLLLLYVCCGVYVICEFPQYIHNNAPVQGIESYDFIMSRSISGAVRI